MLGEFAFEGLYGMYSGPSDKYTSIYTIPCFYRLFFYQRMSLLATIHAQKALTMGSAQAYTVGTRCAYKL